VSFSLQTFTRDTGDAATDLMSQPPRTTIVTTSPPAAGALSGVT